MALQGWEAGELWQQLRHHSDQYMPSWCPLDRRYDCAAYGYAKQRLIEEGLLEPGETPTLAGHVAALHRGVAMSESATPQPIHHFGDLRRTDGRALCGASLPAFGPEPGKPPANICPACDAAWMAYKQRQRHTYGRRHG